MHKILLYIIISFFAFLNPPLLNAEEAAKNPIIGVIDWRAAVFSSEQARQANEKLKKTYEKDADRLKVLESRIQNNQQKLKKNQDLISADDKEKLLNDLQKDILEYQSLSQELERTIKQKEQEFILSQRDKMKEALAKISKEKGLQVILNKEAIFYGELAVDITAEVINYLNAKKQPEKNP